MIELYVPEINEKIMKSTSGRVHQETRLTFKNNEVESAQLLRFDSFKHKILNVDYYPDTWGVIDHGAGIVDKTWIRDQIPTKFSTLYETRSMKEYLSTELEIELFEKAFKIIQEKEMENEALPF